MDEVKTNKQIDFFLPNVPADVRSEWLYSSARNNGWPPKGPFWNAVLLKRDLGFWQKTTWAKEVVNLESSLWASGTVEAISQMTTSFTRRTSSLFSSADERKRILDPLKYLLGTGKLPPTIALLAVENGFEVADGHHRLVALFQARNILKLMEQLEAESKLTELNTFNTGFKNEWKIETLAAIPAEHEVWVGRHIGAGNA